MGGLPWTKKGPCFLSMEIPTTKIVTQILVDDFMQGILPPSYTRFLVKPL